MKPELNPEEVEAGLAQLERLLAGAGVDSSAFDLRARWGAFTREAESACLYAFVTHLHEEGLIHERARAGLEFLNPQVVTLNIDETRAFPTEEVHAAEAAHAAQAAEGAPEAGERTRAHYQVLDVLGEGGMGTVYLARDPHLLRQVALKTVRAGRASEAALARFVHEAQVTSQLAHPNVVPVHSLQLDGEGNASYALELVRGQTLAQIVAAAAGSPDAAALDLPSRLEVFLKTCDAVAYAHGRGVLHRDLKPDNVMVGRYGEVYVLDWGLCKVANRETPFPELTDSAEVSLTETDLGQTLRGSLVGTPRYMSPEQASADPESIRPYSDQFALGLILYELVTLQPAYQGRTLEQVLELARTARLAPPPPGLPVELLAIASKACALLPAERYASVGELAADVRAYLRGRETLALPDGTWGRVRRVARRHAEKVVAATLLVLVLGGALAAGVAYRAQLAAAEAEVARLEREHREELLLGALARRAELISAHFLFYQGKVEGLGGAASYALLKGTPSSEPRYSVEDYQTPGRAPADLADSPYYANRLSPTYPVYRIAPGADPALAERELSRLLSLRPHLQEMFARGPAGPPPTRDPAERRRRILAHEVPIEWAEIGTAGAGVILTFPGAAGTGWTEGYDPRTRPWYVEAVNAYRATGTRSYWTAPYGDLMGEGLVITCSRVLVDPAGEVLGVTALDLSLKDVAHDYLRPDPDQPLTRATLVDRQGRVMISSGELPREAPFPDPELVQIVTAGRHPIGVARRPGAGKVVAWQRLTLLEWTLIVEGRSGD